MRRNFGTALSALALGMGSVAGAAGAQPAANVAAVERAAAPVEDGSELRGRTAWILAAIAVGLIVWGAIELLGDDDEAFPVSP